MPIPIECESCHRQYKVDDKLAGKKVKCKGCGEPIRVPGANGAEDAPRDCLSCGAAMAPGTRICVKCGFNVETGQRDMLLLADEEDVVKDKKKQSWVRQQGNRYLEQLDELIKLLVTLALVGGVVMTVVHVSRSPDGFSLSALLPTVVVLGVIGGIMSPLAALAVNITVRAMKLVARDDTYVRVTTCAALPFVAAMYAGWPETAAKWGWVSGLGWLAAVGLLIYFFRADKKEWIASLVAAVGAMGLSLIVVNLLGGAVNDMAGGLYADMLPRGPWTGLAKGHSPEPSATTATAPVAVPMTALVSTQPAAPIAAPPVAPAPSPPVAPETASTPAVTAAPVPVPPPMTVAIASQPVAPAAPATTVAPPVVRAPPIVPVKMTSPYFASVKDDEPGIRDAACIVAPVVPGDWMLAVKNTDTTTEADRWNLNPLEKKEHYSYPLMAKKVPQFAISSKGDAIAALSFFPRRQLDVVAFDNKTPKKTYLLDLPMNVPDIKAVPAILGIVDPAHYFLRWDMNGISVLQAYGVIPGSPSHAWNMGPAVETCPAAFSPNGRTVAVFGRNQITFFNVDGSPTPRPILVASNMKVSQLGLAFSADSNQIGIFAAVTDLPTLMVFQVKTGDTVSTNLLSQSPLAKDAEAMPHGLLYLPGAQAWLVNGNDLLDGVTGAKFASLGLSGLAEPQVVGPSMLALTFKGETGPRTILAKLDDDKIRAAKAK